MGAFPSGTPANRKRGNPLGPLYPPCLYIFQTFSVYFLKARRFLFNLNTIWRHKKQILKAISGSSPIFAFSNYTTFSQTQTGATFPNFAQKCQACNKNQSTSHN